VTTALNATRSRRSFLQASAILVTGFPGLALLPTASSAEEQGINVLGPKAGYTPQVGTMVSMLKWMRTQVLRSVKGFSQKDLDYLLDAKANSIGALLLHLAATETYYQMNTLEGKAWGSWPDSVKQKWDPAAGLGDAGRKTIKGNGLDYYLTILEETREKTLAEFRKRNDNWLMTIDEGWPWGPTNNFCKWFHVCEHESNHNGQIKLLAKRLPGAKPDNE
jgi:hypothetical protein